MTDVPLSRKIAEDVASVRFDDLPAAVIDHAKLLVLDTLGVAAAARYASGVAEVDRLMAQFGTNGRALSLVEGWRGSPDAVALVNATAAHALDFDDQHDNGRVHVSCVSLPATLAAAEYRGSVSGARFIEAFIAGLELHCRFGLAFPDSVASGWHPTSSFGNFAAAAAAGRILTLDVGQQISAFGIAYAQASGSALGLREQAITKRIGPGFAARAGVLAALMASVGVSGPVRVFEDEAGFVNLYERGRIKPAPLRDRWNGSWEAGNISMKPYPCCRCSHSAIQEALELHASGLRADAIRDGTIWLSRLNQGIVGSRYEPACAGQPEVHAQFNVAYAVAHVLKHGTIDIESFRAPAIVEPDTIDLAQRLDVKVDPDFAANALAPVGLQLRTRDNGSIERRRSTVKGSPEEPMTVEDVVAKFKSCLASVSVQDGPALTRLIDQVLNLEALDDISKLSHSWSQLMTGRDPARPQ
jgi:2-methylcitrate dehydratase PrpD